MSGINGGIFQYANGSWVALLHSSNIIQVHGVCTTDTGLIFTDPIHHKVLLLNNEVVTEYAGSGNLGDLDGPAQTCKLGQVTGIAVEKKKNVYITDTRYGNVKLLADPKPTALFLSNLGKMCIAFGIDVSFILSASLKLWAHQ